MASAYWGCLSRIALRRTPGLRKARRFLLNQLQALSSSFSLDLNPREGPPKPCIPPLNVSDLRRTWQNLRGRAASLPDSARLSALYTSLGQVAKQEKTSIHIKCDAKGALNVYQ